MPASKLDGVKAGDDRCPSCGIRFGYHLASCAALNADEFIDPTQARQRLRLASMSNPIVHAVDMAAHRDGLSDVDRYALMAYHLLQSADAFQRLALKHAQRAAAPRGVTLPAAVQAERERCAAVADDEARIREAAGQRHHEDPEARDRCFAGARAAANVAKGIRSGEVVDGVPVCRTCGGTRRNPDASYLPCPTCGVQEVPRG